jgi:hypothetical protein
LLNDNLRANPDISVTDELDSADAAVISDGLRAYYLSQTGYYDFRPLAVFVRNPQTGKITGGLHGRSEFGLVYVTFPGKLRNAKTAIPVRRQTCAAALAIRHRRLRGPPTEH